MNLHYNTEENMLCLAYFLNFNKKTNYEKKIIYNNV